MTKILAAVSNRLNKQTAAMNQSTFVKKIDDAIQKMSSTSTLSVTICEDAFKQVELERRGKTNFYLITAVDEDDITRRAKFKDLNVRVTDGKDALTKYTAWAQGERAKLIKAMDPMFQL